MFIVKKVEIDIIYLLTPYNPLDFDLIIILIKLFI